MPSACREPAEEDRELGSGDRGPEEGLTWESAAVCPACLQSRCRPPSLQEEGEVAPCVGTSSLLCSPHARKPLYFPLLSSPHRTPRSSFTSSSRQSLVLPLHPQLSALDPEAGLQREGAWGLWGREGGRPARPKPHLSSAALGKGRHLSEPQFPHLKERKNDPCLT